MSDPANIPNWTILLQLGLFFISFYFLNTFLFKPYLALLDARKAKTSGLKEKAIHDKAQAEKLQHSYEAFMRGERQRLSKWTEEERKKISEAERHEVQRARNEASEVLKKARVELQGAVAKARTELNPMVAEYSSQIASKVLGRKINISGSQVDTHARAPEAESVI